MLPPRLAIVDLETTGLTALRDRVTEVAVLTVDEGRLVEEWSTLVHPGIPVPPEIRALTGISDAMLAGAPRFADIADTLAARLEDRVLVAHNARFDYGFLRAEFERLGREFSAKTLCTARLSRALYPEARGHGLDAIAARHGLSDPARHRAAGDARLLLGFLAALAEEHDADDIAAAVKKLLRQPSLPRQLPPGRLAAVPHAPGVYVFLGAGGHPLYIGKSTDLRSRVGAHFAGDTRSELEARLAQEITDLEWRETAGELGALLLEAEWVRERLPAHNAKLRKRATAVALMLDEERGRPRFARAHEAALEDIERSHGVFGSRAGAREFLHHLAREHRLCAKAIGLERGPGPCFGRQLRRCDGACTGEEAPESHRARFSAALAANRFPEWPHAGPLAIVERRDSGGTALEEWLVFERWCFLGRAKNEAEARALAASAERRFEVENHRILAAWLRRDPGTDERVVLGG